MKTPRWPAGFLVALLFTGMGIPWAPAQLPTLETQPWLGYFAVFANRHSRFGVTTEGKISLRAMGDKGEPLAKNLTIPVEILVEEIFPTGKTTVKHLKPETLSSAQQATAKLEKTVIRGKVTGDASFEITLEQNRGVITMGGRLLDSGNLKKNPLRFSLRVSFPAAYPNDNQDDKNAARAFQKKIEDDHLDLTWTDGKRQKQSFAKKPDAPALGPGGPGIAALEVASSAYQGKHFLLATSPAAALTLSNTSAAPLHKGFALLWRPDPAKDPEGKARLSLVVK